jgi:hypothetical protein
MGCFTTPLKFTPLQEVSDGILQGFAEQHLDISMHFVDHGLQHHQSPSRNHLDQMESVAVEVQASQVLQELEPVSEDSESAVLQM